MTTTTDTHEVQKTDGELIADAMRDIPQGKMVTISIQYERVDRLAKLEIEVTIQGDK